MEKTQRNGCEGNNLVLNIASIEHNPDEAINIDIQDIIYDW